MFAEQLESIRAGQHNKKGISLGSRFMCGYTINMCLVSTLPETNSKRTCKWMVGIHTSFLLGWHIFRGKLLVSGRVVVVFYHH